MKTCTAAAAAARARQTGLRMRVLIAFEKIQGCAAFHDLLRRIYQLVLVERFDCCFDCSFVARRLQTLARALNISFF
jgi:hypothetical protein